MTSRKSRPSKPPSLRRPAAVRARRKNGVLEITTPTRLEDVPGADEVPATRGMLGAVRTELLEAIDRTKYELRKETQELRGEMHTAFDELKVEIGDSRADVHGMQAKMGGMKADIQGMKVDIQGMKADIQGMNADIHGMKADIHGMKADIHGMKADILGMHADIRGVKADMARIVSLVEEQNARNKVVLDGLVAVISRQDRTDQRLDGVEATVRSLASTPRP